MPESSPMRMRPLARMVLVALDTCRSALAKKSDHVEALEPARGAPGGHIPATHHALYPVR